MQKEQKKRESIKNVRKQKFVKKNIERLDKWSTNPYYKYILSSTMAMCLIILILITWKMFFWVRGFRGDDTIQEQVFYYQAQLTDSCKDHVFPKGVSLLGVSLEGKKLEDADQMIQEYVDARKNRYITFSVNETDIYQYNGELLGLHWENTDMYDQLKESLSSGNFVKQYTNIKDHEESEKDFSVVVAYDNAVLKQEIARICSIYAIEPINASCIRQGDGMQIIPGKNGIGFDQEAIYETCLELMQQESVEPVSYDFPSYVATPAYGEEEMSFAWSIIGKFTTNQLGSENRAYNIALSAGRMNGMVVYPGQEVSALNDLYGTVSEESGYKSAPTYRDGKQIDDISGGICQTTTTLYNAILLAELEVVYRKPHSMLVTYVPPSLDAMVNNSGGDFIFKNNKNTPVYIEAGIWEDTLYVNIWGKEDRPSNRTVEFVSVVEQLEWPEPLYNEYVDDTMVEKGLVEVSKKILAVVETHPQVYSKAYKRIYEDGVLIKEEVLSQDSYQGAPGELFIASDCHVEHTPQPDPQGVYKFLGDGWNIYHELQFLNGEIWHEEDPYGNYYKQ